MLTVLRLARDTAEIRLGGLAEPMANLKMNLEDVDEALAARDFYSKVTREIDAEARVYAVHFTAMPPEVDAHFQAHLRYARARAGAGRD